MAKFEEQDKENIEAPFHDVVADPLDEGGETPAEEIEDQAEILSPEEADEQAEEEAELEQEEATRSNDPVTLYLREIGSVPLLGREGEVEAARQLEEGEARVQEIVLSTPVALREALRLGAQVERTELGVREVLLDAEDGEEHVEEALLRQRFGKQIAKLRRVARAYDRVRSELERSRVSIRRRAHLEKALFKKKGEIVEMMKQLRLSKGRIEGIGQKIKKLDARLTEWEQKMASAGKGKE
ncbi:MAG: sigma-70 factor domain-containing protein, partial [Candidatus Binatia bacterium]